MALPNYRAFPMFPAPKGLLAQPRRFSGQLLRTVPPSPPPPRALCSYAPNSWLRTRTRTQGHHRHSPRLGSRGGRPGTNQHDPGEESKVQNWYICGTSCRWLT